MSDAPVNRKFKLMGYHKIDCKREMSLNK